MKKVKEGIEKQELKGLDEEPFEPCDPGYEDEEIEELDEPEEEPEFPPDPKDKIFAINMSFSPWVSGQIKAYQKLLYLNDERILNLLIRHGIQRLGELALNPDNFEATDILG